MILIRLLGILVLIAAVVLLVLYMQSKNTQYLQWFKRLVQLSGWFIVFAMVLFLLSRVIRL